MPKPILALLATLSLAACVTTDTGTPQRDRAQSFSLADGSRLSVTSDGRQAQMRYPAGYPLTDAETASYVEDATGCSPGRLIGNSFDGYETLRSYALICG